MADAVSRGEREGAQFKGALMYTYRLTVPIGLALDYLRVATGDVIRAVTWTGLDTKNSKPTARGDWQVIALQPSSALKPIPEEWLAPVDGTAFGGASKYNDPSVMKLYHTTGIDYSGGMVGFLDQMGRLVENLNWKSPTVGSTGALSSTILMTNAAYDLNGARMLNGAPGDWTANYTSRGDGGIFDMPNSADLFWMPTVDPYPISGAFSTAGKINMNYQIIPFTYIERKTGLYAAMKASRLVAYSDSESKDYKIHTASNESRTASTEQHRFPLDLQQTLKGFDDKFEAGDIFKSATQICELWFYPKTSSLTISESLNGTARIALLKEWWKTRRLTADNLREEPYSSLYPRLTTKSNTFTVHYRVQALKKRRSADANVWEEGKDSVVSEYRGQTTIERYIDPNDAALPDFVADSTLTLGSHYRWRTLQPQQFIP